MIDKKILLGFLACLSWANCGVVSASEFDVKPITKKFVNSEILNVRNYPINGSVVTQLKRGASVSVYDINGAWERITTKGESPQWVLSTLLCSGSNCYQKVNKTSSKPANRTKSTQQLNQSYVDTYCSCSGSTNCVGPRGGTFCYTSGGNKRYR